ncbi:homeobox and leucine zipper protein Homez [Crotalus tigris]|uniref:homeobox and leucine zipper protein Homez n=1 Tax=Crotalus tigris TaxID=88082 RepID=UPI00192F34B2|nr:homeobox and leucine zipper protein Homez [Crotalus tigris]XP_039201478.1 homeobox and leucine zipper protein Homez [Crotalus tigris]XP_039201480.1 homeobox and leucine zipper protein Homez [Crotalus tigris]XP_039201481.1 homeobox and leucine zipper protein Homez [Crotalus tigris]
MPSNKDASGCLGSPPGLICLPPISEDLQLVWTQAAQTSDLDGNQHLLQTFSYFPYPSLSDLALLCLRHGLHMEKVKAWFMAQRLRCGISWSAEEIEETRARLIYHQDQLHFSCLLAGSEGDYWPQTCKSPSYHQLAPHPLHYSSKYPENQQPLVTSFNHCSTAQGTKELGTITQDLWKPQGNDAPRYRKPQGNFEPSGIVVNFQNAKETVSSGAYPPVTTMGLDYSLQDSHTMAWSFPAASQPPAEPIAPAVNGGHHPVSLPLGSPVKAAPSSSKAAAGLADRQNHQPSVSDQQTPLPEVLRKPRRKTKEQLDLLKSFFLHRQWARREDYHQLEQVTGLPRAEIIQWFGDTRYALKHGQLKWFRDNAGQSPEPASSGPPPQPCANPPDASPLERYWAAHAQLQEHDLPMLCRKSRMSAEQVLEWFRSHLPAPCEVEVCLGEDDEVDEEVAAALIKAEDEDYYEDEDVEDEEEED